MDEDILANLEQKAIEYGIGPGDAQAPKMIAAAPYEPALLTEL